MIVQNLRDARLMIQATRAQTMGHEARNHRLTVIRKEITQMIWVQVYRATDGWLEERPELKSSLLDGMQTVIGLLHDQDDRAFTETHSDVKSRLRLCEDVIDLLIGRAEDVKPAEKDRDVVGIPF